MDTHTHTIMSGHAYSTFLENVRFAADSGLKLLATTDHGVAMPGGPPASYFNNFKVIPRVIWGVEIMMGVEANIIDYDGHIDMPNQKLQRMDIVIASLHEVCIKPGSREENTKALLNAMENKYVDIIGHPGNPRFEIDIDAVVKKAREKSILIEINNSSFVSSRSGSYDNCLEIARKAREMGVNMVLGSDAHICFDIGHFEKADEIIQKAGIPDELIMNTSPERFKKYLADKGKKPDMKRPLTAAL